MSSHDLFCLFSDLSAAPGDSGCDLLSYLAWSNAPNFNFEKCYQYLFDRVEHTESDDDLHYLAREGKIFAKRFKILRTKNRAYDLAVKQHPTVRDLEEFSRLDPCYSLLFPLKCFIIDHSEMAKEYRGFVPFGKPVIKYYTTVRKAVITGTPDYKAHSDLRNWTNQLSDLSGLPTIAVNSEMFLKGKKLIEEANEIVDTVDSGD